VLARVVIGEAERHLDPAVQRALDAQVRALGDEVTDRHPLREVKINEMQQGVVDARLVHLAPAGRDEAAREREQQRLDVARGERIIHARVRSMRRVVALVVSLNVKRRNLSSGQKAIAAAEAWGLYEVGQGSRTSGKSSQKSWTRDKLAADFGVSDKYVQMARALLKDAPDLAVSVKDDARSLGEAYELGAGPKVGPGEKWYKNYADEVGQGSRTSGNFSPKSRTRDKLAAAEAWVMVDPKGKVPSGNERRERRRS
jgi:hypothetical protein